VNVVRAGCTGKANFMGFSMHNGVTVDGIGAGAKTIFFFNGLYTKLSGVWMGRGGLRQECYQTLEFPKAEDQY
jgi:hypothetical protein